MKHRFLFQAIVLAAVGALPSLDAWDYAGHRIVNQLALDSLPAGFPDWVRVPPSNTARILFLAGEPDRWRNSPVHLFEQYQKPDHEIDLEQLAYAGIDLDTLTQFRYDFMVEFAAARAAHPGRFPAIDAAKDANHTREWPGFLPWAIAEYYAKLRSGFSYLMTLEQYGTQDEIANARADLVYMMGVMGHYVGDAAQPLHTTVEFNGWTGPNPHGYTVSKGFHSWIDGGFIARAGITVAEISPRIRPARLLPTARRADDRDPIFVAVVGFIQAQNLQVEPLYQLEKSGKLKDGGPGSAEGRAFIAGQLLMGGQFLGDLWLTAWHQRAPDIFLRAELLKRQLPAR